MLPKPVDVAGKIGYNNIDVINHLISLIKFNIRFVVSFLLFYTYFTYLILFDLQDTVCPAIFLPFFTPQIDKRQLLGYNNKVYTKITLLGLGGKA